jgi:hypothetical protein
MPKGTGQTLKAGTRIEMPVLVPGYPPSRGVVQRVLKMHRPMPGPDWHIVRFDDGDVALCVHESRFRVIDNRLAALSPSSES